MRYTFTFLLAFLSVFAFAQFTSPSNTIRDTRPVSHPLKLNKAGGSSIQCEGDTIEYARYKASALVAVNISTGYRLGQFYRAPGKVTISGFEFFAWQTMQNSSKVEVYAELYDAGKDSLPSGSPVRVDTLVVDSSFGSGALNELRYEAIFDSAYTTDKPYIVVLSSNDTNRVGIVCNSYTNGDGDGENLGCGTVGGRWFRMLSLNIGGNTLDCDVLAAPFVKYSVYNDFSFRNCFATADSVAFTNTSSPFFFDPMYNRYSFFDLDRFCHRWSYGDGRVFNEVENKYKYTNTQNYSVQLVSTLFKYRGNARCIDTAVHTLEYMPSNVQILGEKEICSGSSTTIQALGNAPMHWYENKSDTNEFQIDKQYKFPILDQHDTVFIQSINGNCSTKKYEVPIRVIETPDSPVVYNDSICLNSVASLVAKSQVGNVIWYADMFGNFPVDTGELFQIGPLVRDTFFFAKVYNEKCTHPGYLRVDAFVSSAFAPMSPITSNDTTICLDGGAIQLNAQSPHTLRWYVDPTDNAPFSMSNSIVFTPNERGSFTRYVDAYDGNCPSSRIPITVDVNHYDAFDNLQDTFVCSGADLILDFSKMHGNVSWYSDENRTLKIKDALVDTIQDVQNDLDLYLVPFEGSCEDTETHQLSIIHTPYPQMTASNIDSGYCFGTSAVLDYETDLGEVKWLDENKNVLASGNSYALDSIQEDAMLFVRASNRHCVNPDSAILVRAYPKPDANFDYQANNDRSVDFLSRFTGEGRYSWDFDDGNVGYGTDYTHLYGEDGSYEVTLVVLSDLGCSDTVTKTVLVKFVGIQDLIQSGLSFYPNPASDVVHVASESNEINSLSIMNATGEMVLPVSVPATSHTIAVPIGQLASGIYFIRIDSGAQIHLVKFIKN